MQWTERSDVSKLREEVDDEIAEELPKIITDVICHIFSVDNLPEVFKIESKDEEAPSGPVSKKLKTRDHQSRGNKVVNTDPNSEYKMLEGENFKRAYGGKNAQHRVFWDNAKGTKMCQRWHSKYYCFDNCDMGDSHVAKDQVPAPLDTEYRKFLKKVKKNLTTKAGA